MGFFSTYTDNLIGQVKIIHEAIPPVDAIEFVSSKEYLNEMPTPFQRVALKTLYTLWQTYPPDEEEQIVLDILKNKWKIK